MVSISVIEFYCFEDGSSAMKNILILEDNPECNRLLSDLMTECREEVTIYSAYDEKEAVQIIADCFIDLFLIDISLHEDCDKDVSGVTFATKLRRMERYEVTPILFITSIASLELHAYRKISCYNYILKPIDEEKQKRIIREAERLLKGRGKQWEDECYYFKINSVLYPIKIKEIVSVKCQYRKLHIHTISEEFEVSNLTMKQFVKELNQSGYNPFVECIRGILINMDYIESIDKVNRYVKVRYEKELIDYGASKWLSKMRGMRSGK
jgi:two-component system LytT family response regulator